MIIPSVHSKFAPYSLNIGETYFMFFFILLFIPCLMLMPATLFNVYSVLDGLLSSCSGESASASQVTSLPAIKQALYSLPFQQVPHRSVVDYLPEDIN